MTTEVTKLINFIVTQIFIRILTLSIIDDFLLSLKSNSNIELSWECGWVNHCYQNLTTLTTDTTLTHSPTHPPTPIHTLEMRKESRHIAKSDFDSPFFWLLSILEPCFWNIISDFARRTTDHIMLIMQMYIMFVCWIVLWTRLPP
jgi:hypothetical protein